MRIADSALAVLGRAGSRGLTHRAVDTEARLPTGSTSYYCRRRIDLLRLAERRLLDLDRRDLETAAARVSAEMATPERVADALAELLVAWLTPPTRLRSLARYSLFGEVAREPELHEVMSSHLELFVELAARTGATTRPRIPRDRTIPAMLMAEGLMVTSLRTGTTPTRRDVARLLLDVLAPRGRSRAG